MSFLHPFHLCCLHVCLSRRQQGELTAIESEPTRLETTFKMNPTFTEVCSAHCLSLMARAPLGQLFTCFVPFRPYQQREKCLLLCLLVPPAQEVMGVPCREHPQGGGDLPPAC